MLISDQVSCWGPSFGANSHLLSILCFHHLKELELQIYVISDGRNPFFLILYTKAVNSKDPILRL